ncbi:hypothetical protein J3Q64DRAFT_1105331 [Phycomyces blakesleeanus]|uniref:Chromo domain-containing protein n=2 Tax=Phycomyces blakesleeanus TaxID=4837 RepID=A0A167MPG9_PHYB8|nr:hypothetical protein PHYBLDRAFT_158939 [Phycomyces blakesleeanus NRRL 1555(-)]OAD73449.1 hypothetical protein PHYBLDRAFT_158939 [Phycomyces blakesleeanus NRRL 1555(-)]|eukprot:XP_018291489.1 hypothetical protein PHYBLDRAFT_158939 [Phycomyces blakesleeanus NRRL 1555(-)]
MSFQPDDIAESILRHKENNGVIEEYNIKWLGYDVDASTWESAHVIETDFPALAYKYKNKVIQEKKQLQSIENAIRNEEKKETEDFDSEDYMDFIENITDWETEVDHIASVERAQYAGLVVYIVWKNGKKTIHHSTEVYAKCPERMLDFYESKIIRAKVTQKDLEKTKRNFRNNGSRRK